MSAPHPKVKDDVSPLSWFGRKPAGHLAMVQTLGDTIDQETESEVRPCTCHPDDNPPIPCAQKYALSECKASVEVTDRLDPINEVAALMRSLTWREMMDLSEAWNTPADILHKWAVGHDGN